MKHSFRNIGTIVGAVLISVATQQGRRPGNKDGEQMIAVTTGWGGDVAKRVNFLEQGGSKWVFKLYKS